MCSNPVRKGIHTEIAKITKEWADHGSEGHPIPDRVFSRSLRSLCVKIRSEKAIHTEIAKIATEQTTTEAKTPNFKIRFATFAISVCNNPIRKDVPHGDRTIRMPIFAIFAAFCPDWVQSAVTRLLGVGGGLEMLGQKLLHRFIERKPIFLIVKTVAFILFDHVFHGHSMLFQRFDDLI